MTFNPFNASCSKLLLFKGFSTILVYPTIFNFWHSGTLALSPERQSARMSKIKNGGLDQYGEVKSLNGIGGERVKPARLAFGRIGVASYGALWHVTPRLSTVFFQLTWEPHKVYNSQLYLVPYPLSI